MKQTSLHADHIMQKAKMAEFAGYDMPIQYDGVMGEHEWTRASAGIFDVSHMGQITIIGKNAAAFLEKITPSSIAPLSYGQAKYTVLMNDQGGMVDDLIITRKSDDEFFLVVNGACKDKDIAYMRDHLSDDVTLNHLENRALIALQGPQSEQVLRDVMGIDAADLGYMRMMESGDYIISRLGYTGEDGFEISMINDKASEIWNKLLAHESVKPIGLAARDSLRLEMGYPLYGHDIDDTTSPIEANSSWIMGKKTNTDFIGAERVFAEIENGVERIRVGIELTGKGVAREGAEIFSADGQTRIGVLTSGGFSPSLKKAIGQGYVAPNYNEADLNVNVRVRGRDIEAKIVTLPFMAAKTKIAANKKAA